MTPTQRMERPDTGSPRSGRAIRWVVVLVLGAAAIAVAVVARRDTGTGAALPADFAMVAYQGQARIGGDEVRFHDLAGRGTPLVLNFWAPSCPPCTNEMQGFQTVADEFGDAVLILSVDVGAFMFPAMEQEARAFLDEAGITYPVAYAVDGDVVRDYELYGLPTTFFVDATGDEVVRYGGLLPEREFRERVRNLVGERD